MNTPKNGAELSCTATTLWPWAANSGMTLA